MNISSVIVIPAPGQAEAAADAVRAIAGAEIALISPEGKLVVTLETDGDDATLRGFESLSLAAGVLSVAMVYHQREPFPDLPVTAAAQLHSHAAP